jgi:tryptophan synthase beta subunit
MASSLVQRNKVVAKRKGATAVVAAAGAGVLAVAGAPVVVAVLGVAGAAYLTWDWFSFRLKNGMRF